MPFVQPSPLRIVSTWFGDIRVTFLVWDDDDVSVKFADNQWSRSANFNSFAEAFAWVIEWCASI